VLGLAPIRVADVDALAVGPDRPHGRLGGCGAAGTPVVRKRAPARGTCLQERVALLTRVTRAALARGTRGPVGADEDVRGADGRERHWHAAHEERGLGRREGGVLMAAPAVSAGQDAAEHEEHEEDEEACNGAADDGHDRVV
jgi:hypothetical protein